MEFSERKVTRALMIEMAEANNVSIKKSDLRDTLISKLKTAGFERYVPPGASPSVEMLTPVNEQVVDKPDIHFTFTPSVTLSETIPPNSETQISHDRFSKLKMTTNDLLYREYLSRKDTLINCSQPMNMNRYREMITGGELEGFPSNPREYFTLIWDRYNLSLSDYFSIKQVDIIKFKEVIVPLMKDYKEKLFKKEKMIPRIDTVEKFRKAYKDILPKVANPETFPSEPDKHYGLPYEDLFRK
jgi:hypothetical protein